MILFNPKTLNKDASLVVLAILASRHTHFIVYEPNPNVIMIEVSDDVAKDIRHIVELAIKSIKEKHDGNYGHINIYTDGAIDIATSYVNVKITSSLLVYEAIVEELNFRLGDTDAGDI